MIKTTFFCNGEMLESNYFSFKKSKAKLIEDIKELRQNGAQVELKPGPIPPDLLKKQVKQVEYWQSANGRKKLVLILEEGNRLIFKEPPVKKEVTINS